MRAGWRCGGERAEGIRVHGDALVLRVFLDDEDGFTTVAVAVALLLSLTLVFSAASAGWIASRSSEVQRVADAAALAGANAVAAFSTVTQVLDACALSMGLTGIVVCGAGLVASCVPGLQAVGAELCSAGGRVLDARRSFARSAAEGIERLEATLPLLVVANSASCVAANSAGGVSYVGCAIPFPLASGSDFSALEAEVGDEGMGELSEELQEASSEAGEARSRVDEARVRGWMADCGASPGYCLWERASTLAGLSSSANPYYASAETWGFGAALLRARAYYAVRLASAAVVGGTAEELTDAACRRAFYEHALSEVRGASWSESSDGTVAGALPSLPSNASETRACALYTRSSWPCTDEDGVRTLHCSLACPGATGAASGTASLAQLDAGAVARCDACQMDVGELGRVAAASTSIENGFEHHWREIVAASRDYARAREDLAAAEGRTRELAEQGEDSFSEALEQLSAERPTLCPPGAWGCVAVVARADGETVPAELTSAFLSSAELPAGAAVSAATLAPDESTDGGNVLASFLDGLGSGSVLVGAANGVLELWGSLLVSYGSAYESLADAGGAFLDGVDGVLGGSVGSWLRDQIKGAMQGAGLEPVDLRLRKPVVVGTQDVLDKSGYEQVSLVRELVARLPDSPSALDFARGVGVTLANETGLATFTVAELEIPGTGVSIPLTIDLSFLLEAA